MHSEIILNASLSVIFLLLVATATSFFLRKSRIPYTATLVIIGILVALLANKIEFLAFLTDFKLSPELVFYVFLPTLIFESSFNLKLNHFKENIYPISVLSTIGLIISMGVIAWGMNHLLNIPWAIGLLFGAIISATDPISVLALFKKIGAPKRLSTIIEGESLFNDGVVLVLFGILISGKNTIIHSFGHFIYIILGGILIGTILGFLFSKIFDYIKNSKEIEISLTLILAHSTFIIAEYFLGVSGIMATVFSGIILGNYGAHKISYQVKEIMSHFWEYASYLANSILFLMVGITIFSSKDLAIELLKPLSIVIGLVIIARMIMVYTLIPLSNLITKRKIPLNWAHVIQWGGLRGALAIALILSLPSSTPYYKEMFIFTVGVIFFTTVFNGFTINTLLSFLGLNKLSITEEFQINENQALIQHQAGEKLNHMFKKGFISKKIYNLIKEEYKNDTEKSSQDIKKIFIRYGENLSQESICELLHQHLLNTEKYAYKKLYYHGEITQEILNILLQNIEKQSLHYNKNLKVKIRRITYIEPGSGIYKILKKLNLGHFCKKLKKHYIMLRYEMYRARIIGSDDALRELKEIRETNVFDKKVIEYYKKRYEKWHQNAEKKIKILEKKYPQICIDIQFFLAHQAIYHTKEKTLEKLKKMNLTSNKIYKQLRQKLESKQKECKKYWQ